MGKAQLHPSHPKNGLMARGKGEPGALGGKRAHESTVRGGCAGSSSTEAFESQWRTVVSFGSYERRSSPTVSAGAEMSPCVQETLMKVSPSQWLRGLRSCTSTSASHFLCDDRRSSTEAILHQGYKLNEKTRWQAGLGRAQKLILTLAIC